MNESFKIDNLKCEGCVKTALNGVNTIDDISDASITLENNTLTFNFENKTTNLLKA